MPEDTDVKPIHKYLLASLVRRFEREIDLKPLLALTEEQYDAFKAEAKEKRIKEWAALKLDTFDTSQGSSQGLAGQSRAAAWTQTRLSGALPARISEANNEYALAVGLVPATYNMELRYHSTDVDEYLVFLARWAFMKTRVRMNYRLRYLDMELPIETALTDQLTTPTHDMPGESAGYFVFNGTAIVSGWLSSPDKRDTETQTVVKAIDLEDDVSRLSLGAGVVVTGRAFGPAQSGS